MNENNGLSAPDGPDRNFSADLTTLEAAVLRTVAYVDLFDYPLTASEVHRYLIRIPATTNSVEKILANGRLVPQQITRHQGYFTLPGRQMIVDTRRRRTETARTLWPAAVRYGLAIAAIPFVRMVAITGSLAVNNVDPEADIDYLIVTENGRVWLARALTIILVRLAHLQGITLCPNYFLAERALLFTDRNLYTAREIAQMVPIAGFGVYHYLRRLNSWTADFLPNAAGIPHLAEATGPWPTGHEPVKKAHPGLRRVSESLLRTRAGNHLERWEMNRKIRRFRSEMNDNHIEAAFCPDWCKGHFHDHAQRILNTYEQTLNQIEQKKSNA